jgi:hypothetical protein
MYNWYDDENQNFIKDIEYVKGMYDAQVNKVKQEEYMKDLLFADYVRKVKAHRSRYDYIENVFREARNQFDKKKKKEREQLSTIEEFIRDDFFNNDSSFKISKIVSGGYENYYWNVEFEGYGQTVVISIPNMNNINTSNILHAHNGMFTFEVKESDHCWSVKKMSYKIEDIAEYIKSYFGLDRVNEDTY